MNVVRFGEATVLVELPAELTDSDEKQILNATMAQFTGKQGRILLDFSAVTLMNGLGAYLLVKLSVIAMQSGKRLLAFGVSSHYQDVLKITGLTQVIRIYPTRKEVFTAAGVNAEDQPSGEVIQNTPFDLSFWAKPVPCKRLKAIPTSIF